MSRISNQKLFAIKLGALQTFRETEGASLLLFYVLTQLLWRERDLAFSIPSHFAGGALANFFEKQKEPRSFYF